ncbi:hypothetical protein PMSD_01895 [Paenibacillus macquariensis subsp. defensor]|nr:hypothetical protein PMSD_01895 [Paenibacillus macquariensis subsp. defensor]
MPLIEIVKIAGLFIFMFIITTDAYIQPKVCKSSSENRRSCPLFISGMILRREDLEQVEESTKFFESSFNQAIYNI